MYRSVHHEELEPAHGAQVKRKGEAWPTGELEGAPHAGKLFERRVTSSTQLGKHSSGNATCKLARERSRLNNTRNFRSQAPATCEYPNCDNCRRRQIGVVCTSVLTVVGCRNSKVSRNALGWQPSEKDIIAAAKKGAASPAGGSCSATFASPSNEIWRSGN